ncbi:MAG: sugar-binding protein [Armatimonadetes bacterium]|nr:sugar-binding protein [Armatimonadota bacterium]
MRNFCLALATVFAVSVLGVAGCGRKTQPAGPETTAAPPVPQVMQGKPPLPGKKYQFALVPKLRDNPVFQLAYEGAQAAAKELGDVEVVFQAPERADTAKQVQEIESLIAKKVDGIAISCNQGDALVPVINKAIDAGIPTITFDSDSPKSKRITYYGIDSFQAGVKQATLLIEAMKKLGMKPEGKVVIQSGVAGAPNLEERIDGVKSVLAKYPKIKLLETLFCDDDTSKAVAQLQDVVRAHPDLKGMVLVGGWALFSECPVAFQNVKPGQIAVVGFDALPEEWEYVRQGYVYALVAQRCWHWGYASMKILHGIVAEGKKYPSFIDSGLDIVTKDNVDEYAKKWETKQFDKAEP